MRCPKCNGKTRVIDNVYNPKTNESYRRRECKECGHNFYTTEFEVPVTGEFLDAWSMYHRKSQRKHPSL